LESFSRAHIIGPNSQTGAGGPVMECNVCGERPEIPAGVTEALRQVQDGGLADMYDRETVIGLVGQMGLAAAHRWLASNRHLYFDALAGLKDDRGFAVRAA
jgi:hypothetical protein